jgi:hypothetical protein
MSRQHPGFWPQKGAKNIAPANRIYRAPIGATQMVPASKSLCAFLWPNCLVALIRIHPVSSVVKLFRLGRYSRTFASFRG